MGLAGRQTKQRIGEDPRNTRWATDTSNPGFKLLSAMGYSSSSNPTLGLSTGPSSFKRLPTATLPSTRSEGALGLGAKPASGALNSFLPGSSAPMFVVAGAKVEEDGEGKRREGGGLGDLLERLNRSSTSGSATPLAASSAEGTASANESSVGDGGKKLSKAARAEAKAAKRAKKAVKAARKSAAAGTGDAMDPCSPREVSVEDLEVTPLKSNGKEGSTDVTQAVAEPAATVTTASGSRISNPRMASRAKYLASKKLATRGNAAAMAEILGLPAASASGAPAPACATPPPPLAENAASPAFTVRSPSEAPPRASYPAFVKSKSTAPPPPNRLPSPASSASSQTRATVNESSKDLRQSQKRKRSKGKERAETCGDAAPSVAELQEMASTAPITAAPAARGEDETAKAKRERKEGKKRQKRTRAEASAVPDGGRELRESSREVVATSGRGESAEKPRKRSKKQP